MGLQHRDGAGQMEADLPLVAGRQGRPAAPGALGGSGRAELGVAVPDLLQAGLETCTMSERASDGQVAGRW